MLEILVTIFSVWLFISTVRLAFRITWGAAKIVASILLGLAMIILILSLAFAGGVIIFLPVLLIAGAFGILKRCA